MERFLRLTWLILLFCCYAWTNLLAAEISVTISPVQTSSIAQAQSGSFKPIVAEPFMVIFSIPYKGDEAPGYPEFTPVGLEVERRSSSANSFNIGPRGMEKKTIYSYIVNASKAGTVWLKNISVLVDGKVRKLPSKSIQVVAERPKAKDVFLVAEVDTDKIFVGQGFNINYYLYYNRTKVAVDGYVSHKDPSFANIIKRFIHLRNNEARESIDIDGIPFHRIKQFSLRAFAENAGVVDLGPMTVEFEYRTSNYGPSYRKKITSNREKINILPLPGEIPANFTGLVGEHSFELVNPRSRYLVNEPIEMTVQVKGPGALEKYTLPVLLDHPELESFDAQSELVLDPSQIFGTKKFNLTYLARSSIAIPAREISMSYFDPSTEKFVEIKKQLPAIAIAGGGGTAVGAPNSETVDEFEDQDSGAQTVNTPVADKKTLLKMVLAPDFIAKDMIGDFWRWTHLALGILIVLVAMLGWRAKPKEYKVNPEVKALVHSLKKEGINYSRLHRLLLHLVDQAAVEDGLRKIVEESQLPQRSKDYFLYAINAVERENYGMSNGEKVKFEEQHFRKLVEHIKNEDHK